MIAGFNAEISGGIELIGTLMTQSTVPIKKPLANRFLETTCGRLSNRSGEGGIRTPDTLADIPVFETGAFGHSATSPCLFSLSRPLTPAREQIIDHELRFAVWEVIEVQCGRCARSAD